MKLAVIPARGGSKRIPRKNIRNFCGLPIIAWSIKLALSSNLFDKVIVSTDDEEISIIAKQYGADAPFVRPKELSDDNTATSPVIAHAIKWAIENGVQPDFICCIYATAPFIRENDLRLALEKLQNNEASFVFPITTFPFPIQRALKINGDGKLMMFKPEHFDTRSQDLPEAYHDAGQFYWGTRSAWLSEAPIFGEQSLPIIIPRYRVQDIDTVEDWERAELMFSALS